MTEQSTHSDLYAQLLEKVNDRLEAYLKDREPSSLYEPLRYLVSGGGKRIRPVLTMLCCGAVGGEPKDALDAASAVEILHNFTLAHDDIMDSSPVRRNRPTVYKKFSSAAAILAGDVAVGYAYALLPMYDDSERSEQVLMAFTRGLIEVCEGQSYDMEFNERNDITLNDYFLMITKKTARLLETSAVIGGHIGCGDDWEIQKLSEFAVALGLAFQIQDDILDLTAEQLKLGKKIGQDIIEGKKTYLICKAIELAKDEQDKALLEKFIDGNGLGEDYVPTFQDMFERLGVIKIAEAEVERYSNEAKRHLSALAPNLYTETLDWLVDWLNKRNS